MAIVGHVEHLQRGVVDVYQLCRGEGEAEVLDKTVTEDGKGEGGCGFRCAAQFEAVDIVIVGDTDANGGHGGGW